MWRHIIVLVLVALGTCCLAQPWSMAPYPDGATSWVATMAGLHGVLHIEAESASAVSNSLNLTSLLRGHDRITGVVAVRDNILGTNDILVYVASFDGHAVYRYQLDGRTGAMRGELSMHSPSNPRALALASDDRICVTGAQSSTVRVMQCYAITRALNENDGATIDEYWIMVSQYQWEVVANTDASTDYVLFDSHAKPLEAARGGSVWIDDTHGSLVRFAVDSVSGMHMPDTMTSVYSATEPHTMFTASGTRDRHYIVEVTRVRLVSWVDNAPSISTLDRPWEHMTTADWLRAVVWRACALDQETRVRISLVEDAIVVVDVDRTEESFDTGEAVPTPSVAPPSSTATPSRSSLSSPTPTSSPTATALPSPSPYSTPVPQPSAVEILFNVTNDASDKAEEQSDDGNKHKKDLHALWALVVLVLPCCAIPVVAYFAWKHRRGMIARLPRRARIIFKGDDGLQPMDMSVETRFSTETTSFYDTESAMSVAIPMAQNHSFSLGGRPEDNESLLKRA